jgi:hypothetical protein
MGSCARGERRGPRGAAADIIAVAVYKERAATRGPLWLWFERKPLGGSLRAKAAAVGQAAAGGQQRAATWASACGPPSSSWAPPPLPAAGGHHARATDLGEHDLGVKLLDLRGGLGELRLELLRGAVGGSGVLSGGQPNRLDDPGLAHCRQLARRSNRGVRRAPIRPAAGSAATARPGARWRGSRGANRCRPLRFASGAPQRTLQWPHHGA